MTECSDTGDRLTRLEAVFHSFEKAHARIHELEQDALKLQANENERRLEGLNQLRQDVLTDRGQFVRRELFDAERSARNLLVDRVGSLEGRFLGIGISAMALSAIALVVALVKG